MRSDSTPPLVYGIKSPVKAMITVYYSSRGQTLFGAEGLATRDQHGNYMYSIDYIAKSSSPLCAQIQLEKSGRSHVQHVDKGAVVLNMW